MSNLYVNNISPATGNTVTVSGSQGLVVSGSAIITGDLTVTGTFDANVLDFKVTANTMTFGDAASDTLTFNAATASVANGLNFDSNTLVIDSANNRIGIGAQHPATKLHVSGNVTVEGAEGGAATILLKADQSDDAGDDWTVVANADQTFTIGNDIASAGSSVAHVTITPNSTVGNSVTALAGKLKVGGNVIQASDGGATMTLDTNDNVTFAGGIIGTTFSGSSTFHTVGAATFGSTIESTGSITAGGVTLTGALSGSSTLQSVGDTVFGGALNVSGAVTVGVNDVGSDVRIFSATNNEGVLYDASEDELALLLTTKLKFHDVGGGEEIFASANGHLEVNAGTTLDITAPTVDINASTAVTIDGPALTVADSADGKPVLTLKTTHTTKTSSGELQFLKDAANAEDGEVLGQITFFGEDDGASNTAFAKITAISEDVTNGTEDGSLTFNATVAGSATDLMTINEDSNSRVIVKSDLQVNDDVYLQSDDAAIHFGLNNDVVLDHRPDSGLRIQLASEATGLPTLSLKNTGNFASGPAIHFAMDNSSGEGDGDILGLMKFFGSDSTNNAGTQYATIEIQSVDITNGTEDGGIIFKTLVAGADTNLLDINKTLDGGVAIATDLQIGDDLFLKSDDAVIHFGADSDIILDHRPDAGLRIQQATETAGEPTLSLKNTGNFATGPGIHFAMDQNGGNASDGDVLGFLKFIGDDDGNTSTFYSTIEALSVDVTNGTEDGGFIFKTLVAGSDTNLLDINNTLAGGVAIANSLQIGTGIELGHASDTTITRTGSGAIAVEGTAVLLAGAQTAITTDFNAGRKVGRDAHNLIDFSSDDKVTFRVADVDEIALEANEFSPTTNDGIALGSAAKGWSDLFIADGGTIQFGNDQDVKLTDGSDGTLTLSSALATMPLFQIKNTTNDADGARLQFIKDKGAAGAANDVAGVIEFIADDANQDQVLFAKMEAAVSVHTNGQEGGKLSLGVATHDGEMQFGLVLVDGDAEDEVDVEIGKQSTSMTTINGSVTVTSTTVFTPASVHNFTGNDANATIPITSTYVKIDANGSARTGMRFGGAGTAGALLIVENEGGENVTFHATGGTALITTNVDNDTIMPGEIVTFVSNGSAWFLIGGDLQAG